MNLAETAQNEVLEKFAPDAAGTDHKNAARRDFRLESAEIVAQEAGPVPVNDHVGLMRDSAQFPFGFRPKFQKPRLLLGHRTSNHARHPSTDQNTFTIRKVDISAFLAKA